MTKELFSPQMFDAPNDAPKSGPLKLLFWARGLRDFGDGFVAILLPAYLTSLGVSPFKVGVLAAVALLGSALLTFLVGLIGARHDHRYLLVAAAGLMTATGIALSMFDRYAILLVIAFAGSVNRPAAAPAHSFRSNTPC
jgi:MFS family permease